MPSLKKGLNMPGTRGLVRAIPFLLVLGLLPIHIPGWAQEEEEAPSKGAGVHLKLRGAWTTFLGGDIDRGTAGMYDLQAAEVVAAGFDLGNNNKKSFRTGYEFAGDIVYYVTPRVGVGVGAGLVRGHQESSLFFHWPNSSYDYRLMGLPDIKVFSLRLGLFYAIPLSRLLTVCVSAGPEYHWAAYKYGGNITTPYFAASLTHRTKARQLGIFGGLGLEIRMNNRLAFVIEALGRYARISGFEGKEETYEWSGGLSTTIEDHGTLFFIEGEEYPRLDIPAAGVPPAQVDRKAVLDFSGLSLQAGFNFKF